MNPSRREFLNLGACGMGVAALGRFPALGASEPNPFAYKVDHLAKTDPKLIRFEQVSAWKCTLSSPRQVAIGAGGPRLCGQRKGRLVFTARTARW